MDTFLRGLSQLGNFRH